MVAGAERARKPTLGNRGHRAGQNNCWRRQGLAAKSLSEATVAELPVRVEGHVPWLINRKADGWQLAAFNPHGVTVDFVKGERSDPKASAPLSIRGPGLHEAKVTSAWPESTSVRHLRGGLLEVEIGPGGLIVIEW